MSANLDLVRSIYADWERGDFRSAEWADPEIEFVMADGVSPGHWVGLAEMANAWRGVLSAWKDLRGEAEEYRALDGERVLVLDRRSGHGKVSGIELAQMPTQGGTVWQVRDTCAPPRRRTRQGEWYGDCPYPGRKGDGVPHLRGQGDEARHLLERRPRPGRPRPRGVGGVADGHAVGRTHV